MPNKYEIAVLPGDGIGPDVVDEALKVLAKVGIDFNFQEYPCGADCYLECGDPLPHDTLDACRRADATLLGAMGNPEVRWPDGTELRPQVDLRFKLDLYAGVRPIFLYATHHTPLRNIVSGEIDFVILRENVEGLFAAMDSGIVVRDESAIDSMVITRTGTERVVRYAFELARRRGSERKGRSVTSCRPSKVTCVDKANILRSMAFFRDVFNQVAENYHDVLCDYAYVDAMALYLIQRPQEYDVMVMENMYGDILSDLAAGLVGGMGMAPSGDIGEEAAVFQPSHGTAPDISGKGIANPTGIILSAGMMLRWLGHRHEDDEAITAAERIDRAVGQVLKEPKSGTPDIGGIMSTGDLGTEIAETV
tara:strand:- start:1628 stop:2719 length:1092 start_codon:yes stop_codon:yes gene_type:complete